MTPLEKLKAAYPDKEIIAIEIYLINGVLHVPKAYLARYMNVSERTIFNWQKLGLEASEYSLRKMNLYDLEYVIEWYRFTVDQKQSRRRRGK